MPRISSASEWCIFEAGLGCGTGSVGRGGVDRAVAQKTYGDRIQFVQRRHLLGKRKDGECKSGYKEVVERGAGAQDSRVQLRIRLMDMVLIGRDRTVQGAVASEGGQSCISANA
jgi:hypothetical protein